MKRKNPISIIFALAMVLLWVFLGRISVASGQTPGNEVEVNNPCGQSQDFGMPALPFAVNGELPDISDVDFFKFTGTPGSALRVGVEGAFTGQGTLEFPVLGFFDSACNRIFSGSGGGPGLNVSEVIVVPEDGVFVLAASSYPDVELLGLGQYAGTYQLTLAPFPAIGSISGRVVDAISGVPLPGESDPFAYVALYRCEGVDSCFSFVAGQAADSHGGFLFKQQSFNVPLEAGTYQIVVEAQQYQRSQTDPFVVSEAGNVEVDVPLQPFPVRLSDPLLCDNLPPKGGECSYSLKATNHLDTHFFGTVWTSISAFGIGSVLDYTAFQTLPSPLILRPGKSKVVRLSFHVPRTVANGAFICPQVFVGKGPHPFFNTITAIGLGCIQKGETGAFSVVPEQEARKLFPQLDGRSLPPQQGPKEE